MSHQHSYPSNRSNVKDAAPLGRARSHAAESYQCDISSKTSMRRRKRGPRSRIALVNRMKKRCGGKPADVVSGESETQTSASVDFSSQSMRIYSINIRCLLANIAEVIHHVELHDPHIILIQESWLNSSIEHVHIPNYSIISRRDRHDTENRGGIIAFAKVISVT